MKKKHIFYTLALLAVFSLPACSDEATSAFEPNVPESGETARLVDVNINISTQTMGSVLTRASENGGVLDITGTDNHDLSGTLNEVINYWFMIFVNVDNNQITNIVKRVSGVVAEPSDPTREEKFTATIPTGKYNIYTFGNITEANFEYAVKTQTNATSFSLAANQVMPDIENLVWKDFHNQAIGSELIPLSSVMKNVDVIEGSNNSVDIWLERVVGKIQFYFANKTSATSLKIKKFEMTPLRNKSYIYKHISSGHGGIVSTPARAEGDPSDKLEKSLDWTLPVKGTLSANQFKKCDDLGFYVNESVPEPPTGHADASHLGHFKIKLELERTDAQGTHTEYRTSMLHNLRAIERNQWYLQPITFTDWVLQPEIHYYPPIGGYPVVQVYSPSNFEECYSIFQGVTSDSPFQIRLRIHDLAHPEVWYDIHDETKVKKDASDNGVIIDGTARNQAYYITVSDPNKIFKHQDGKMMLSLDNSGLITSPDKQLTGYFSGATGEAIISVYANIEISSGVFYTYERDLYVIVED